MKATVTTVIPFIDVRSGIHLSEQDFATSFGTGATNERSWWRKEIFALGFVFFFADGIIGLVCRIVWLIYRISIVVAIL
jgi:hypothetical protein